MNPKGQTKTKMSKQNESKHTDKDPKVMPCNCRSEYQDQKHGQGMRLHNPRKANTWACTVCGNVKGAS